MISYTAAQLNALLQDETRAKMAIEFGSYYFCSGQISITYDSDVYSPRPMEFDDIVHGEMGVRSSLEIADEDYVLTSANYSSRFASTAMDWHFHLRNPAGSFEHIQTISWYIRYCQWDKGVFKFNLFGNTGFKRRAGLSTMSRSCDLKFKGTLCGYSGGDKTCNGTLVDCESKSNETQFRGFKYAPEPGMVLETTGIRTHYTPPPPPGDDIADDAFEPSPWGVVPSPNPTQQVRRPTRRVVGGGGTSEGGTTTPRRVPR